MRRLTGPGKVDDKSNPLFVIVRLYNFDTDWHELKPEHETFLDTLRSRAKSSGGIYVLGLASRSGGDDHNLKLSQRRREAVVSYVNALAGRTLPLQGGWAGEQFAFGPKEDDPYDRAVIMTLWTVHPPPPPTPAPPPPAPSVSTPAKHTRFQIRMTSAFGTPVTMSATFEIEDLDVHERSIYQYKGIGPPLPGFPFSWSGAGPWNEFRTLSPRTSREFAGMAEIESISSPPGKGPNWSVLTLRPGAHPPIGLINFQTGRTEGFGLSAYIGDLIRQ